MITSIIVISIITYVMMAVWTFGYICANLAEEARNNGYSGRMPSYHYDEMPPLFGGIFWPIYLLFKIIIGRYIIMILHYGEDKGIKHTKQKFLRIAEEKRIRVELENAAKEAEEELERSLGKASA